jgi:large subunit ribosomal protein L3
MAMDYLIGKKVGMTRIFDDLGGDYPVSIIEAGPCEVVQVKSVENDGYAAVQLGFGDKSDKHVSKPEKGHFAKAKVSPRKYLKEFPVESVKEVSIGETVESSILEIGDLVTVSGVSKGKGFAGHMKRHGFSGGRKSHGKNSVMRKAGAVGAGSDPSRIWPGTRMAGRMGNDTTSVKNLEVVRVDKEKNLVFVKGAVPGSANSVLYIAKQ